MASAEYHARAANANSGTRQNTLGPSQQLHYSSTATCFSLLAMRSNVLTWKPPTAED